QATTVDGTDYPGFGRIKWALQFPDVVGVPDGNGAVSQFLDNFLRGNRDDQQRRAEGSILQALDLMNDKFVASRVHATGPGTGLSRAKYQTAGRRTEDRKSTRLNSSHVSISYAVFCLKKKNKK